MKAANKKNTEDAGPRRSNAGNRPKNFLERLIPKVWYWAVFSRVNWSDARFDIEFIPDVDGQRHNSTTRVRAFERIRKNGVFPESKNRESVPADQRKPRQRYFDLVQTVDSHPSFRGTARVIRSPFWKLLNAVPGDLQSSGRGSIPRGGTSKIKHLGHSSEWPFCFSSPIAPWLLPWRSTLF